MAIDQWLLTSSSLLTLLSIAAAATLSSAFGLAASRLVRSAAVRHALLLASLLLVLMSPLSVGVATNCGVGWTVALLPDVSPPPTSRTAGQSHQEKDVASAGPARPADDRQVGQATETHGAAVSNRQTALSSNESASSAPPSRAQHSQSGPASSVFHVDSLRRRAVRRLGSALAIVWLLGAVFGAARLARGYFVLQRLRSSLRPPLLEMQSHADGIARRLGLRNTPRVYLSPLAPAPLVMGLWKPVVVLPCGIDRLVAAAQLRGMLVHELAHIARFDPWIGLAQRVTKILCWWQPLVHRLSARLSEVREDLCDNHVIRQQGGGRQYARALVELASRTARSGPLPATVGLLEESGGLEARIHRLLDEGRGRETRLSPAGASCVAAFCLLTVVLLAATTIRAQASPDEDAADAGRSSNVIRVNNSDQLRRAAGAAAPGSTILLAPGTYRGGLLLEKLQGTATRPIVLAAADPDDRPVFAGGSSCIHLTEPAYVELRNLVLQGARANGLNVDDGGSKATPARHVALRGLTVRDIGSGGNHDGVKLSGVVDFRVEDCTVERWGKSGSGIDLVGCRRGVITSSTFRDGGAVFGNGVQMKGGSRNIAVRRCRFENAGGRAVNIGGSTGLEFFRPRPEGFEAKEITVEDCTFLGSMAAVAFVGVDGADVRHNTIYRPARWVVRILQENTNEAFVASRNGRFTNNIVVMRSDEIGQVVNIGPKTGPDSFTFSGNWWYCLDRPEKTSRLVRLPTPESGGTYGQDPQFVDASHGDLTLAAGSPASDAGPRKESASN